MKRIVLIVAAIGAICLAGCAQKTKKMESKKTLVAYYSATGTTEEVAKLIADVKGATLCEIEPSQKYTSADLNWNDKKSRSTLEMADAKSRPAIKKTLADVKSFDVVYIGFPIWWDEAPRVINTFIETYDLKGKTVIPFATSGGSSISNSVRQLRATYPNLNWKNGKLLNGASREDVSDF